MKTITSICAGRAAAWLAVATLGATTASAQPPAPADAPPPAASTEVRLGELEGRLDALDERLEAEALERMVQEAESEARAGEEESASTREFLEGSLALQKLNPELTLSADVVAALVIDGDAFYAGPDDRSGLPVREVGLHLQHVLDPYSMFKSAFAISPSGGLALEEVYVTWSGLVPSVSLTVGRFRQGFGVLNRWHEHDLDQTEYPLALTLVLGEEGLVGNGVALKWMMPALWAHANELGIEIVDGTNEQLFAGEYFSVPTALAHLKSYYDLSPSTYLELGLSGMFGFNNRRGLVRDARLVDEPWRETWVGGADLTVYWSPPQQARYRSLTWRSELYWVDRELGPEVGGGRRSAYGAYSYLLGQLSARWFVGLRGDVVLPSERQRDRLVWDVVPFATFWQSEFVYLRLEYRHVQNAPYVDAAGEPGRRIDNRVLVQLDFAAGPHKHEKY